jgi:alkylation response protein AidB-like acyl-CoA dehydrogenase
MTDLIFVPREEYALLADTLDRLLPDAAGLPTDWQALWADLAASGALAAGLSEADGGLDDARAVSVVAERLGQHGAVSPFIVSSAVVARVLAKAPGAAAFDASRARLADGSAVATLALLADRPLAIENASGGYKVSGACKLVSFGAEADHVLVEGATADGKVILALLSGSARHVERAVVGIDGFPYADIRFDGVVPADQVLAIGDDACRLASWCRDAWLATLCADAVGAMATLVKMTGDYLKVRQQFGQRLSSYQVLQHRYVDMDMALTESRTVAEWAAGLLDAGSDDARRAAVTTAQFVVARAATRVSQESVQLHGGIGMAQETPVGRYFKRLLTLPLLFGDEDAAAVSYSGAAA